MSLYACKSILEVLQRKIKESGSPRGYLTLMAKSAGVHASYLSRVLQDRAPITADQLANLAEAWGASEKETQYMMQLLIADRATTPALKRWSARRLAEMRKEGELLEHRLKPQRIAAPEESGLYYSSWLFSAVNMCLQLPDCRTVPTIAKRLMLPTETAMNALETLVALGLAKKTGERYTAIHQDVHAPNAAPWATAHHLSWRARGMTELPRGQANQYHFTGVYALSRADWKLIQTRIKNFIAEIHTQVRASPEEEVAVVTIDAFPVTVGA